MFKVLVTGGSGFLGKNLLEKLSLKKYLVYQAFYDKEKKLIDRVRKFNNSETEPLIDFENIEKIDSIVHCAAKLPNFTSAKINNLDEYRRFNTELTMLTAKQAVNKGIKRFVYLSSALACDVISDLKSNSNSTKFFYATSKLEAENRLKKFSKQTGLEVVILRPPLIYGRYVKGNFKNLLGLVYKGIPIPFKNIKTLRSYVGVDNLTDLIIVCLSHPKAGGQSFFVSDGCDISIKDLIEKISKYMKKSSKLFAFPVPLLKLVALLLSKSDEFNSVLKPLNIDNSNLNKILGWRPVYNLNYQIEKTVKWYLKNI